MSRGRRWARLCSRRMGWALLWTAAAAGMAVAVNLAGIHLLGGIGQWEQWMAAHAGHFLAWRVGVYVAMGMAWRRLRRRLVLVDAPAGAQVRLLRAEIAAVVAVVVAESTVLLREP